VEQILSKITSNIFCLIKFDPSPKKLGWHFYMTPRESKSIFRLATSSPWPWPIARLARRPGLRFAVLLEFHPCGGPQAAHDGRVLVEEGIAISESTNTPTANGSKG